MSINKIVEDNEDESSSVLVAATLSKAAEANEEIDEKCDEIRKVMSKFKSNVE